MTPRRPLLALAAALVMPGLGHVYAGDPVRGLVFAVSIALTVPSAAALALRGPTSALCVIVFVGVAMAVGLYVLSIADAVRCAKAQQQCARQPYQRVAVYCLYVVCGYLFALGPATAHVRNTQLEAFKVPSSSMLPTILPGDRVFADKTVGHPGGTRLWHGALVVFVNPNDRTAAFVKRVVGLPGDHVEISGRRVSVNGRSLSLEPTATGDCEPTAMARQLCAREQSDRGSYSVLWPEPGAGTSDGAHEQHDWTVPNGQVFVLGDNRATALDSRRIGTVPLADVIGVVRQVWFSRSLSNGARWDRIGKRLD